MARLPKPWYWEERKSYYVTIRGERHNLGEDKVEADRKFHELMARPSETINKPEPVTNGNELTIIELFDKYLDWCQKHRELRTYEWYRDHIQNFINTLKEPDQKPVSFLKPFHVVEWVDKHENWGPAYRKGAIVAIQRPMNWAMKIGHLQANPIKNIDKPRSQRRESQVTPEQFATIIERYSEDDPFRKLMVFAWDTGARPQETSRIEARHLELAKHRILLPPAEAKGKRKWRVIYLTERAEQIATEMAVAHPEGPLFRNENNQPWSRFAISNRFDRLHLALGIETLKAQGIMIPPLPRFNRRKYANKADLASARKEHKENLTKRRKEILKLARQNNKKFAAYDFRHGFATRKLIEGHDFLTIAELMGHSDGRMLASTYQHLDQHTEHLRKVLEG
jgi:integrase